MSDELVVEFRVDCSVEHAFDLWARRTTMWWPKTHSKSRDPDLTITIEGRIEGRIFETTSSGEQLEWGVVTRWDPPHGLAYLWHIYGDRADATEVEVSFAPHEGSTRVRISQRGFEGVAGGEELRRRNEGGWRALASAFTDAVDR